MIRMQTGNTRLQLKGIALNWDIIPQIICINH